MNHPEETHTSKAPSVKVIEDLVALIYIYYIYFSYIMYIAAQFLRQQYTYIKMNLNTLYSRITE